MDNENYEEVEEISFSGVLSQSMSKLKLPELSIDSDEDECDEDDVIQPLIFQNHEKTFLGDGDILSDDEVAIEEVNGTKNNEECKNDLQLENLKDSAVENSIDQVIHNVDSGIGVNDKNLELENKHNDLINKGLLSVDDEIPILRKHDITEIELDHALHFIHKSDKINVNNNSTKDYISKSNRNDNSFFEKLTISMESLKEMNIKEKAAITESIKLVRNKMKNLDAVEPKSPSTHTQVLDLRNKVIDKKTPVKNSLVFQRYGRVELSDTEEDTPNYIAMSREQIKDESAEICKNKGRTIALSNGERTKIDELKIELCRQNSIELNMKINEMTEANSITHLDSEDENKETSMKNLIHSIKDQHKDSNFVLAAVDDMLSNVDSIMYDLSYPENEIHSNLIFDDGNVQQLYDDTLDIDDEVEVIQNYIINDDQGLCLENQQNNNAKSLESSFFDEQAKFHNHVEALMDGDKEIENCDHKYPESAIEIVQWSTILEKEQLNGKVLSPLESPRKDASVFDNLFADSFLSSTSSSNKPVMEQKIDTTPKRNIFGKSKGKIIEKGNALKEEISAKLQKKEQILTEYLASGDTCGMKCHSYDNESAQQLLNEKNEGKSKGKMIEKGNVLKEEISPKPQKKEQVESEYLTNGGTCGMKFHSYDNESAQQLLMEKNKGKSKGKMIEKGNVLKEEISAKPQKKEKVETEYLTSGDTCGMKFHSYDNESAQQLLKEKNEFMLEILDDITKEENDDLMIPTKLSLDDLTKQLNLANEYVELSDEINTPEGKEDCLACTMNADDETPLKHYCNTDFDETVRENSILKKKKSEEEHTSVPENEHKVDNISNKNKLEDDFEKTDQSKKVAKNKKKKKNKSKKILTQSPDDKEHKIWNGDVKENEEKKRVEINNLKNKDHKSKNGLKRIPSLSGENTLVLEQLKKFLKPNTILFDEVVSFSSSFPVLPDTNKQLLLMKVALDEPGVIKSTSKDGKATYIGPKNSDNFIGIMTLLILLLRGSKWEIPDIVREIPFDVVSLQQCCLDSELFLVVGITENQNTHQQYRSKRTKLGSTFFHAVSSFLNNTYLENLLCKIKAEIENKLIQNQKIPNGTIWQQVDSWQHPPFLGSGKLSSFISVIPDMNALGRIQSTSAALLPSTLNRVCTNIDNVTYFETKNRDRHYASITIGNILTMTPKHVAGFFETLREESIEICGMKIAYIEIEKTNAPVLTLALCEIDGASVDHGRLLLNSRDKLRGVDTSLQTIDPPLYMQKRSGATIEYSLNVNKSFREVVKFFGPRYDSVEDIKKIVSQYGSKPKNGVSKNNKNKNQQLSTNDSIPLLVSSKSSCILLVSVALRTTIFSLILSLAGKLSLQLKSLSRKKILNSQLTAMGISDQQLDGIQKTQKIDYKKYGSSFYIFLFHGNSAVYKINGLINRLIYMINFEVSSQTINLCTKDKSFYINDKSISKRSPYVKTHLSNDYYFIPLHVNDVSLALFSSKYSYDYLPLSSMDIYHEISKLSIRYWSPSYNLISFMLFGNGVISKLPELLKMTQTDYILPSLKYIQKCFRTSESIQYETPLELLTLKHFKCLNKHQILMLLDKQCFNKKESNSFINRYLDKEVIFIIYKAIDQKHISKLREEFIQYLNEEEKSSVFIHEDNAYIFQLMYQFFHPSEIYDDNIKLRIENPPIYIQETHPLLNYFDKIYNLSLKNDFVTKVDLSKNEKVKENLKLYSLPVENYLYRVCLTELNYPLQILLGNEESYTGFGVEFDPEYTGCIIKILSRFQRMGFQISGVKFPVTKNTEYWMYLCLKRRDAISVLKKMFHELETSYPSLNMSVEESVNEVQCFIKKYWKNDLKQNGGIFHCNNWAVIHELNFEKDDSFDDREMREIEWNPNSHCQSYAYDYMREKSVPIKKGSLLISSTVKTHEASVIIFTEPLITGRYLEENLPNESTYLELWRILDSIGYKAIGLKMTILNEDNALTLLDVLSVKGKKRNQMVKLLSCKIRPFVAIAFLGSCILSNIWLHLERNVTNEKAVEVFKRFSLVSTNNTQSEFMLTSLFTRLYPNAKLALCQKIM